MYLTLSINAFNSSSRLRSMSLTVDRNEPRDTMKRTPPTLNPSHSEQTNRYPWHNQIRALGRNRKRRCANPDQTPCNHFPRKHSTTNHDNHHCSHFQSYRDHRQEAQKNRCYWNHFLNLFFQKLDGCLYKHYTLFSPCIHF